MWPPEPDPVRRSSTTPPPAALISDGLSAAVATRTVYEALYAPQPYRAPRGPFFPFEYLDELAQDFARNHFNKPADVFDDVFAELPARIAAILVGCGLDDVCAHTSFKIDDDIIVIPSGTVAFSGTFEATDLHTHELRPVPPPGTSARVTLSCLPGPLTETSTAVDVCWTDNLDLHPILRPSYVESVHMFVEWLVFEIGMLFDKMLDERQSEETLTQLAASDYWEYSGHGFERRPRTLSPMAELPRD